MPHALLLKYPGTNCDAETERALRAAGFSTQIQPIATATPEHVAKSQLVVLGGGFSYGDYVTSGRLAQLETERFWETPCTGTMPEAACSWASATASRYSPSWGFCRIPA